MIFQIVSTACEKELLSSNIHSSYADKSITASGSIQVENRKLGNIKKFICFGFSRERKKYGKLYTQLLFSLCRHGFSTPKLQSSYIKYVFVQYLTVQYRTCTVLWVPENFQPPQYYYFFCPALTCVSSSSMDIYIN